ncbi:Transcription initiation factor TFIID subunit 14 [Hondaea fermentalgiana]|uniref:Transcription initiation factor TFIID subunit 14 n=1 Tax=Hondaea fermentalgiana TaxID=2315210 RepID=A0A2R5G0N1_9STRA|nr:Transcription initiation factor TFIID subunit 14 [Hondaea fermentalgiana]|eukprot:GBG23849.1 Transcription initiation factor TFIID subunit 14 [Hondaea fermentalgiana]
MLLLVDIPGDIILALDVDPTFAVADVLELVDEEVPGLNILALEARTRKSASRKQFTADDEGTLADLFDFPFIFEVRLILADDQEDAEEDDENGDDVLARAEGDLLAKPRTKKTMKKKMAQPTIPLTVKTLTGKTIYLDTLQGETWGEAKERIFDREGIPPDQQRLIIAGQQVLDDQLVSENGSSVDASLVLRLRGGEVPPTVPDTIARISSADELDIAYLNAYGPAKAVAPKETFILTLMAFADAMDPSGATGGNVQVGMHGPVLLKRNQSYPVHLDFDQNYFQCAEPENLLLWTGTKSMVSFAVTSIMQDAVRSHIITACLTLPSGAQARVFFSVGVQGQSAKPEIAPDDFFAAQTGARIEKGSTGTSYSVKDLRKFLTYMSGLQTPSLSAVRPGMQYAPPAPDMASSDEGTSNRVLPQDFALHLPDSNKYDHDIFISYRRAQLDFADRLRLHLERFGYTVFLDVSDDHGLGAGNFRAQLDRAVKRSRVLMPLFTAAPSGGVAPASELSSATLMARNHANGVTDWCLEELRLACANPKMLIVPVFREHVDIGAEMSVLPDGLDRVKSSNALPIYDAVFGMCVRKINRDIQDFFAASNPAARPVMHGKTVVRPIVYGSVAFFLGKRSTEDATHEWSIYVRGLDDEDLSYMIRRVIFTLHPSCQVPVVTCDKPPYVVTQSGWGEFDAKITVVLRDEDETSFDMIHFLRLYPAGSSAANVATLKKKPVVEERYEEIIFHEPTEAFYKTLSEHDINKLPRNVSPEQLRPCFTTVSETECMKSLVAAQKFVSQEIDRTCQELSEMSALVTELREIKSEAAKTTQ